MHSVAIPAALCPLPLAIPFQTDAQSVKVGRLPREGMKKDIPPQGLKRWDLSEYFPTAFRAAMQQVCGTNTFLLLWPIQNNAMRELQLITSGLLKPQK